jgi:hypothetical protein
MGLMINDGAGEVRPHQISWPLQRADACPAFARSNPIIEAHALCVAVALPHPHPCIYYLHIHIRLKLFYLDP